MRQVLMNIMPNTTSKHRERLANFDMLCFRLGAFQMFQMLNCVMAVGRQVLNTLQNKHTHTHTMLLQVPLAHHTHTHIKTIISKVTFIIIINYIYLHEDNLSLGVRWNRCGPPSLIHRFTIEVYCVPFNGSVTVIYLRNLQVKIPIYCIIARFCKYVFITASII